VVVQVVVFFQCQHDQAVVAVADQIVQTVLAAMELQTQAAAVQVQVAPETIQVKSLQVEQVEVVLSY
jgi:hypothetical protein